jgi:hypothetical protein
MFRKFTSTILRAFASKATGAAARLERAPF